MRGRRRAVGDRPAVGGMQQRGFLLRARHGDAEVALFRDHAQRNIALVGREDFFQPRSVERFITHRKIGRGGLFGQQHHRADAVAAHFPQQIKRLHRFRPIAVEDALPDARIVRQQVVEKVNHADRGDSGVLQRQRERQRPRQRIAQPARLILKKMRAVFLSRQGANALAVHPGDKPIHYQSSSLPFCADLP